MKRVIILAAIAVVFLAIAIIFIDRRNRSDQGSPEETESAAESAAEVKKPEIKLSYDFSAADDFVYLRTLCEGSADEMLSAIGKTFNCLGKPDLMDENGECWFLVLVSCDGAPLMLTGDSLSVYLWGEDAQNAREAADALAEYILTCEPIDIRYEAYYLKEGVKEFYVIENGVPDYHVEVLKMSDEEYEELYKRIYGSDRTDDR